MPSKEFWISVKMSESYRHDLDVLFSQGIDKVHFSVNLYQDKIFDYYLVLFRTKYMVTRDVLHAVEKLL